MHNLMKFLIVFSIFLFNICYSEIKEYAVSIENNVIVYISPDTNSSNLIHMEIGRLIQIISNSIQNINNINETGKLVFIDSLYRNIGSRTSIKGWVPSFNIAQQKDFIKVTNFGQYVLKGNIGDTVLDYSFNKNGTFKKKIYGENEKYLLGNIFQRGHIIEAMNKDIFNSDFFYLDNENNLFTIYPDDSGNPIQAKRLDK